MRSKSKSRASKRKHESDSGNTFEPKSKQPAKKNDNGLNADRYCWLCHTKGKDETCVTCSRSYHNGCLDKASASFTELGVCPECQIKSVDGTELHSSKYLNYQNLKKVLDVLIRRSFEKNRKRNNLFMSWPEEYRDNLFKIIDFEILVDNVVHVQPYTKTAEFYGDVKYIYHNVCIAFGANKDEAKAAENLKRDFKAELLDLEACPECYYYMYCCENDSLDPFGRLCESPHDIVWAQLKGHPYWPAKCLKVVKGIAHIRYFGEHEVSRIPISKCFFLSESHPKDKNSKLTSVTNSGPKSQGYKYAKEELLRYIQLFRRKYGEFPFYPHKTPYKPVEKQKQVFIHSTEGNCNRNTIIQMKLEGNVNEDSEMYPVNPTIVVDSEENLTFENSVTNNIPTSNGSGTESQYSTFDQLIDTSMLPGHDTLNKNPLAVTSINMTFSTDENNFNTENATSVVTSFSSLPPADTVSNAFSHSSENTINHDRKNLEKYKDLFHHNDPKGTETAHTIDTVSDVVINNVSNHSSLQPYSSRNFVNNFPIFTGGHTDFDDEVIVIEEHRNNRVCGFNPEVVLPVLLGENPEVRDLLQKSRYLSDALIIQLYASFGKNYNNVGMLSKLCVDLRKSKSDHKKALEEIDNLRKKNETNNNTIQVLNDNVNKLEIQIEELQAKLKLEEVTHNEENANAKIIIKGLKTKFIKKIEEKAREQYLSSIDENQKAILESIRWIRESEEMARELRAKDRFRMKELEELKVKYQRATDKIKSLESQIGSDAISNYKRMHYCCVCERSAGEVCCLNTSYCSRECKESHAEEHKKYCRKDKITSQIVQQRVISQQSVVMVSHGVVHSGRPGVNNPSSPEVSDTEKIPSSPYHKKPQTHRLPSYPLLPTPRYGSSSSRSFSSKGKRRSCR